MLLKGLHIPAHHHWGPHVNVNSHKSLSPLCLSANETCRFRYDPSTSDNKHKSRREQRHKACLFCRGPMLINRLYLFKDKSLVLAFLLWDMSWFVFVFLSTSLRLFCRSTMSGYDERLLAHKDVLSGVWRCTSSGFFLQHIKGEEGLALILTQTFIYFLYTLILFRVTGRTYPSML